MEMNVFVLEIQRTDNYTFSVYESIPIMTHLSMDELYLEILDKHAIGQPFVLDDHETIYKDDSFELLTVNDWTFKKLTVYKG